MLPRAFSRALKNMFLPGILKLLFLCIIAYVIGWTALAWGIGTLISSLVQGSDAWLWQIMGTVGGGVIAWFLFPLLYPVLIGFFDDYMASTIEREDYPQLPRKEPPFWPTLWHDAKFTIKAVVINLIIFPLYLLLGPFGAMLYYAVNGYLLGSQFFFMSAGRHVSRAEAERLRKENRNAIILAGVAISFFATIPFLNLAVPVIGVATMLHFYHLLAGHDKQELLPPV